VILRAPAKIDKNSGPEPPNFDGSESPTSTFLIINEGAIKILMAVASK
jgi:hypothetical protein